MIARESKAEDKRRGIARLGPELERRLSAYTGAAASAGVSLLALATSAEAKIVYTPENTSIPVNGGPVLLDLTHDGVADFSLSNTNNSPSDGVLAGLHASAKA